MRIQTHKKSRVQGEARLVQRYVGDRLYEDLKSFASTAQADVPVASERKLAGEYGISVDSVRRALERLVRERILYKVPGRGRFVAEGRAAEQRRRTKTLLYTDCWSTEPRAMTARLMRGLAKQATAVGLRLQVVHADSGDAFVNDERSLEVLSDPDMAAAAVPYVYGPWLRKIRQANPRLHLITIGSPNLLLDEKVTTVIPDYYMLGLSAALQLSVRGARRLACVQEHFRVLAGALECATPSGNHSLEILNLPHDRKDPTSLDAVVARLLEEQVQGVIFSDDHLALRVMQRVERQAPGFWRRVVVASQANTGEPLLPPQVIRLEFDFEEVGMATVTAAMNLIQHGWQGASEILIEPHLVLPKAT